MTTIIAPLTGDLVPSLLVKDPVSEKIRVNRDSLRSRDDKSKTTTNIPVLTGDSADNLLDAGPESEKIQGKRGNDTLRGGKGDDTLRGGAGNDKLLAGRGNDLVIGGAGDDFLTGGDGDDIIQGGIGIDTLRGGAGNDLFKVTAAEINGVDFNAAVAAFFSGATQQALKSIDIYQDFVSGEDKLTFAGVSARKVNFVEVGDRVTIFDLNGDGLFDYGAKISGLTAGDIV